MKKILFTLLITTILLLSANASLAVKTEENIEKPNVNCSNNDPISDMISQLTEEMMLEYIQDLVEIAERHPKSRLTGTQGCIETRDYITQEFGNLGYNVVQYKWSAYGTFFPYNLEIFESENIAASLRTKSNSEEKYYIIAHYDTISTTPSADDNSAGVAAVLSAAKIMKDYDFNHDICFLLVSGEEEGLLGSNANARYYYENNKNINALINLDMIGYSENDEDFNKIRIYEKRTDWIINIASLVSQEYSEIINLDIVASSDDAGHGSDQRSFWNYGFDSVFYHEYTWNDNKDTGQDTIENMNPAYATKIARFALATIAKMALSSVQYNSAPEAPSSPQGPGEVKINVEYAFTTTSTDPEGNNIYYMFDWGDGTHSDWTGPYESGEEAKGYHTWKCPGESEIKVKAKDELFDDYGINHGIQSDWSEKPKNNIKIESSFFDIIEKLKNAFPLLSNIFFSLI